VSCEHPGNFPPVISIDSSRLHNIPILLLESGSDHQQELSPDEISQPSAPIGGIHHVGLWVRWFYEFFTENL
jgi:hypothetical protein